MRYDLFVYIPCDEFDAASVKLVCVVNIEYVL